MAVAKGKGVFKSGHLKFEVFQFGGSGEGGVKF